MESEREKEIFNILKNNIFIDKSGYSGELQIAGIFKTAELLSKREAEKDRRIEEAVRILNRQEERNAVGSPIDGEEIIKAIEVLKGEK